MGSDISRTQRKFGSSTLIASVGILPIFFYSDLVLFPMAISSGEKIQRNPKLKTRKDHNLASVWLSYYENSYFSELGSCWTVAS
jgi:hypothetical protein